MSRAKRILRALERAVSSEIRERPLAYAILAVFLVLGVGLTPMLFPAAPPGVGVAGGLAFGVYAALCAVPEKFL